MELRQLRVFVAIVEERSFTRAAGRLHVVQSAVSASLATLEAELGAVLLDRGVMPAELTDAGRALLGEARAALAAAERAVTAVNEVRGGVRGTVRLGFMQGRRLGGPSGHTLAAILDEVAERHPGIEVVVRHTGGSLEMAEHVRDGTLDVAFVALPTHRVVEVRLRAVGGEPLVLLCHREHPFAGGGPVTLEDLQDETFADFPPSWGSRLLLDAAFADRALEREVRFEINNVAAVQEFAARGLAVVVLPVSMVDPDPAVRVVEISGLPTFTTSLATSTIRAPTPATAALVGAIAQLFDRRED